MKSDLACFVMPMLLRTMEEVDFARSAISSVQAQTDNHWRLVVIDDGSPPALSEAVESRCRDDSRIEFLRQPATRGSWLARNTGIRRAANLSAGMVLYIDSDDLCDRRRLERAREMLKRPEVVMVYSGFDVIDEAGAVVDQSALTGSIQEIMIALEGDPPQGDRAWQVVGEDLGYATLTSTVCAQIGVATANPFPPELVSEDTFTWYQYMASGGVAFDSISRGKYRIRSSSSAGSAVRDRVGAAYYAEKARVDRSGYLTALSTMLTTGSISDDEYRECAARFLVRLAETMAAEAEDELGRHLVAEALDFDEAVATAHLRHRTRSASHQPTPLVEQQGEH